MTKGDPFRYFKTSREITRLVVMLHVRFPLALRNGETLQHERCIDVSYCPSSGFFGDGCQSRSGVSRAGFAGG
jgi:hypothetical protein